MQDHAPADDAPEIPAALRTARPRSNLPVPPFRLVGRAAERAGLLRLLRDPATRLVALTGIGGVGKTRLALEVVGALASAAQPFPDGVFLVALDTPLPPENAEPTLAALIAGALGLTLSGPEPPEAQVIGYLAARRALLLLDGEPLRPAGAFLARLLAAAPRLTLLVAARERIGIAGETVQPLAGLPYPADGDQTEHDAVTLLLELAQRVNPAVALDAATQQAAGRICRAVDGLPLAIELAAGWTGVLSVAELAAELEQNLDLLATDRPDVPQRHQSLRAAFNTSWELLSEQQRAALRRLAGFRGAFDREDAAALTGGPQPALLPLLAALVDRSLVQRVPGGGAARYQLPHVIRQYALEQLAAAGEVETVRARHAAHTLGAVAQLLEALRGADQRNAIAAVVARLPDVQAAWDHALATGADDLVARAAPALFHVYDTQSWFAAGAALFGAAEQVLATRPAPERQAALGIVQARAGWFTFHLGRLEAARAALRESLARLEAAALPAEQIFALNYLAAVTWYAGELDAGRQLAQRGRALALALADRYGEAVACNILGQIAYDQRDFAAAAAWSSRSLALEEQLGNRWSMAFSLTNLGKAAYASGGFASAEQLLRASLAIRSEFGDVRGMAICLSRLGDTAAAQGEPVVAADHYEQSYRLFAEIGNQWGMGAALLALGQLVQEQRATPAAARLLQEALRHALAAQSRPQIVAAMAALGAAATTEWQRALGQLAAQPDLDLASDAAAQQLALASVTGAPLSLAEALSQARAQLARAAEQLARNVGAPGPDTLTARELEVLRLVDTGMSDAQVADHLILSRRTVSTHLGTIYSKLQVNSRTAAIRAARDQGLLG